MKEHFSENASVLTPSRMGGMRRSAALAACGVLGSAEYRAMVDGMGSCRPYDPRLDALCGSVGRLLLDGLPQALAYAGTRGLIRHAVSTRDARELVRIVTGLADRGVLG